MKTEKTVDVRWHTHRIRVPYSGHSTDMSVVYFTSLTSLPEKK